MKWILLAGSSNTRKTFTLTEVAVSLVRTHGATLLSPATLPVRHPASSPTSYPYYSDDFYELTWKNKKIVIVTDGDMPKGIDVAFNYAKKCAADVLVSATRAKSRSGHIAKIDKKVISGGVDVFIVAALDHSHAASASIVSNRISQIIDML